MHRRPDQRRSLDVGVPRAGSRAAFEELFARYHEPLYGFLRRRLNNPEPAEDLAQETFIAVIRAASRHEPWALVLFFPARAVWRIPRNSPNSSGKPTGLRRTSYSWFGSSGGRAAEASWTVTDEGALALADIRTRSSSTSAEAPYIPHRRSGRRFSTPEARPQKDRIPSSDRAVPPPAWLVTERWI